MRPDILQLPVPGDERAFVLISGHASVSKSETSAPNGAYPVMSFVVIHGDTAVEWEPRFGPIQVWHRSDSADATPNYIFEHAVGDWSQIAVQDEDLAGKMIRGDFAAIFAVLHRWAER